MGEHKFRWRYANGRVSWTYPSRDDALDSRKSIKAPDLVLEKSDDNGKTWREADE